MSAYIDLDPWIAIEEKSEVFVLKLKEFLEDVLNSTGKKGFVFGLSGGLDSSVLAVLLRRALSKERVLALIMPDKETSIEDLTDALNVAKSFDISYLVIEITPIVDVMLNALNQRRESIDRIVLGNIKTRVRMTLLYYYANLHNLLVASTSDRTEYLLGYFTKWGDIAGDVHPLIGLYKTQLRILARKIGVPERIIVKPSSPGFWPSQRSEDEIGAPFEVVDKVLYLAIDKQMPLEEIAEQLKVPFELVSSLWKKVIESQHKRKIINPFPYSSLIRGDVEELLKGFES